MPALGVSCSHVPGTMGEMLSTAKKEKKSGGEEDVNPRDDGELKPTSAILRHNM